MKGQCVYPLVSEEHREAFKKLVHDVFQGNPRTLEFNMAGLMGQRHILYTKAVPMHNDNGEIVSALAVTVDVTERKEAEEKLQKSEEKYRFLFDAAGDAIFIHDENAQILAVNALALKRYGYTRNELLAMKISQIDTPEDSRNAPERIEQLMQQGYHFFEAVHQCKDGSIVITEVSARRIIWDGIPAMMSICRDITERKLAEQEREKLVSELQDAIAKVKTLSGFLPICASCKKIRDDKGYWNQIESYIRQHTEAEFTHSLCDDCAKKLYPAIWVKMKETGK